MGSFCSTLCGRSPSSNPQDPFTSPGRTLASAPPPKTTSSVPPSAGRKIGGPPQRLGSNSPGPTNTAPGSAAVTQDEADARRKAAEAAEARAKGKEPKGRLEKQLQEQKKQTRNDTLGAASAEERRRREVDEAQDSRTYN